MSNDLPFDLTLTEEQRMGRESMRRFAQERLYPVARKADEAGEPPEGFYQAGAELGLSLMPIPEEYGGAGMGRSPLSNTLNLEALGQGDFSLALGMVTPLAFLNALLDFASPAQQAAFLPRLTREEFVPATIALMEPRATFEPSQLHTRAVRQGEHFRIDGEKRLVPLGSSAELILVIAELEGEGPAAFVVEGQAPGLRRESRPHMGLRPLDTAAVILEGVQVPAENRLEHFNLQRLVDLGRIGTCALAVGCAQAVLDLVTPYVNERHAFGEPVSHRQSVAFMVADIAIELEAMRLLVWRAASRAEQGLEFHREASLARVLCAEKAMEIGTNGLQLMGGAGFIRDYPMEIWYRNLRSVGLLEGTALI